MIRKLKYNNVTIQTISSYLRQLDHINEAAHILIEQKLMDLSMLGVKTEFNPLEFGTKMQKLEDGNSKILFKVQKDPQRLIEREIKKFGDRPPFPIFKHESMTQRMQNIMDRKRILEIEFQAEIDP